MINCRSLQQLFKKVTITRSVADMSRKSRGTTLITEHVIFIDEALTVNDELTAYALKIMLVEK